MNQIRNRQHLIQEGICTPTSMDWRVKVVFTYGTDTNVRVSPGRLDQHTAITRAKRHLSIFDETVIKDIEAMRVAKSVNVSKFGMIQK